MLSLSLLLSSTNNPRDIESVQKSIPGGEWLLRFAGGATNTPTIGSGSRIISHLYMNNDTLGDAIGIRFSSSLSYSALDSSAWVGAGILNKPTGAFHAPCGNSQ